MVGIYKDPEGKNIFPSVTSRPSLTPASKDSETKSYSESEVMDLRRRITELEETIKGACVGASLYNQLV